MSTNESPKARKRYPIDFGKDLPRILDEVKEICEKNKVTLDQGLKALQILELRRLNNINIDHGDVIDEQLFSILKVIDRIDTSVQNISDHD
jgi:hypothetical protein